MQDFGDRKHLIGDVSRICNIPKKTLRYYDDLNIIKPEKKYNNYRYYSIEDMYNIIILKYFKELSYTLEEIKKILLIKDFKPVSESLENKILGLEKVKKQIENRIRMARDWKNCIDEAEYVLENYNNEIKIKNIEEKEYLSLKQNYHYDYKESIININWVKTLELNNEEITGTVILKFDSIYDKMNNRCNVATILQESVNDIDSDIKKIKMGGKFVSTYHIGKYQNINETYEKINKFILDNNYKIKGEVFERYVVDYWTNNDENLFVTELLVPIE